MILKNKNYNCTNHKEEQNNAICSNMDGPRDHHTKWRKSGRQTQVPNGVTGAWTLNATPMNLSTKQKQTHRHGCQGRGHKDGLQTQTVTYRMDKQQGPTV